MQRRPGSGEPALPNPSTRLCPDMAARLSLDAFVRLGSNHPIFAVLIRRTYALMPPFSNYNLHHRMGGHISYSLHSVVPQCPRIDG
jgi:hypothetical protein